MPSESLNKLNKNLNFNDLGAGPVKKCFICFNIPIHMSQSFPATCLF